MRKKGTSPFLSAVILAVVALGVALPVYHFLSLETVRQGLAYPLVLSYFTVDYTEGSQLVLVGLKNMGNAEIYNASPLFLASSSSLAASPYSASVELLSGGSASALNAIQASCSPSQPTSYLVKSKTSCARFLLALSSLRQLLERLTERPFTPSSQRLLPLQVFLFRRT